MDYLLALDQGTSSSRSIVFDAKGRIVASAQREFAQHYPQPGWVEHDPLEIWQTQLATAREAIAAAQISVSAIKASIKAIGITNQRETTLVWDRATGQPIHPAIVWQDRRTAPQCTALREAGHEHLVQAQTGLRLDPYFSATKLAWILDQVPGARARAERGELAFGTVDSWLIWQLTGGRVHATDVSNASRTLLFDIRRNAWSEDLLALFNIPRQVLPTVLSSAQHFGNCDSALLGASLPICGVAGDQQAALFGQGCFEAGLAKNTYGTGCFMLMHTGARLETSAHGLITTAAAQTGPEAQYALEGSVFIGGAVVQWLRDGLHAIESSAQVQALAMSVPDAGGVMLVPAFTGLGAPYWKPDARGAIVGLSRGSSMAHIARAALESIAFQSAALLSAMSSLDSGNMPLTELRVDGGACVNNLLMQFQADLIGLPVVRPRVIETTALGAAYLAGLGSGLYSSLADLAGLQKQGQIERVFEPQMPRERAAELMAEWERAVRQTVTE